MLEYEKIRRNKQQTSPLLLSKDSRKVESSRLSSKPMHLIESRRQQKSSNLMAASKNQNKTISYEPTQNIESPESPPKLQTPIEWTRRKTVAPQTKNNKKFINIEPIEVTPKKTKRINPTFFSSVPLGTENTSDKGIVYIPAFKLFKRLDK